MRKLIIGTAIVSIVLFFSSCSLGGARMIIFDDSGKKADARLEQVLEAIKDQDKDVLRELFSEQARNEAVDLDEQIDYLFKFFQGEIESWEGDGLSGEESNDHGHKTKEVSSYYYINTDKQKYFFLLRDHTVDTDHPDNVGLYLLLVVKSENDEKIFDGDQKIIYDGDQKISHVGVYIPLE